jgi:hypothetical protein
LEDVFKDVSRMQSASREKGGRWQRYYQMVNTTNAHMSKVCPELHLVGVEEGDEVFPRNP